MLNRCSSVHLWKPNNIMEEDSAENSILSCRNRAITNTDGLNLKKKQHIFLKMEGNLPQALVNHLKLPRNKKCFIISMSRL